MVVEIECFLLFKHVEEIWAEAMRFLEWKLKKDNTCKTLNLFLSSEILSLEHYQHIRTRAFFLLHFIKDIYPSSVNVCSWWDNWYLTFLYSLPTVCSKLSVLFLRLEGSWNDSGHRSMIRSVLMCWKSSARAQVDFCFILMTFLCQLPSEK